MPSNNLLVLAPHPDDEVIGCGGYLSLATQAGRRVRVVVVTDGARGLRGGDPALREEECRAGLERLGVEEVRFWRYPDGGVPLSGDIVDRLRRCVEEVAPNEIALPAPGEEHPDHRRVTRLLVQTLEGVWRGRLLFYETVRPQAVITRTVDISPVIDRKLEALGCHRSQTDQYDYAGNATALGRLRGVAVGVEYAEAFLEFPWDGSAENFFETRPLISVVVRGDDPELLAHALGSLTRQSYDQFEVILVWHGQDEPDLTPYTLLDIRVAPGGGNRSHNLNLGLDAARGQYVAFLDHDDVFYPHHLESLLVELQATPHLDMVYAGCRVARYRREGERLHRIGEEEPLNRPPRPGRLMVGNFIPNHAALYRASVFRALRFDESLEAYEDWELLTRLERSGFRFDHLDEITCEYRLYGEDEAGEGLIGEHRRKGYLPWREAVMERVAAELDGGRLEMISSLVDGLEIRNAGLERSLAERDEELTHLRAVQQHAEGRERRTDEWLRALGIDRPGDQGLAELVGRSLPEETLFSIILPVYDTPPDLLTETLFSIADQAYPGWELCLVDDGSTRADTLDLLASVRHGAEFAGRLHYHRRERNGGISAAANDAIALGDAPYLVFLDHDDLLHREALLALALGLRDAERGQRRYGLLYTDSRAIDRAGQPLHVYRKPEWSPETLLHLNYINHLTVARRDLVAAVGGLRGDFDGGQDWDLLLRLSERLREEEILHIPETLYDWRATETSLAYSAKAKPWAFEAAKRAVLAHLERLQLPEPAVEPNPEGPGVRLQWRSSTPPVEVIIPTHSNLTDLKRCLRALLDETDYPALRVTVVANRVELPELAAFIEELERAGRVRVVHDDTPFNWSALNNRAATGDDTPLLLFMNDDVEATEPGWLRAMVRYLELSGVGVVGATLRYPDGGLQHNGVRTDREWVAGNITVTGAKGELKASRNVSAVTGACLLVSRELFHRVGGFDERLAVNYNDIDFCLGVREAGLRIVQAADVRLIHREMASRGKIDSPEKQRQWDEESAMMREKWGERLTERYLPSYRMIAQGTRILQLK